MIRALAFIAASSLVYSHAGAIEIEAGYEDAVVATASAGSTGSAGSTASAGSTGSYASTGSAGSQGAVVFAPVRKLARAKPVRRLAVGVVRMATLPVKAVVNRRRAIRSYRVSKRAAATCPHCGG